MIPSGPGRLGSVGMLSGAPKKNKIKHTQVNTNAYALCTRHSFKSDSLCAFYDDDGDFDTLVPNLQ